MQPKRTLAFLMVGIALVLALFSYFTFIYQLGFPDGFISELGRAQRRLAYIFIGVSVILSAWFIYLGMIGSQKKIAKPLATAVMLYSLIIVAVLFVNRYYHLNLLGDGGG